MHAEGGPRVSLRNVWKVFEIPALRGLTLGAAGGEVVAVLGPNGAGKTTLLRIIAGIARPTSGEVRIAGHPPDAPAARRAVGLAGHQPFLAGHLTALENLRFFADLYGLPPARAHAALEEFGLLRRQHHQVRTLSRGTVQRLSLARALLHEPDVVLLDEPFTGLDTPAAALLSARIRHMRDAQRCVIMATHNLDEVRALADSVAVLVRGRLVAREAASLLDTTRLLDLYASVPARPAARPEPVEGPKPVGSA